MSDLTDFAENLLLEWMMTGNAATRPTAWYVSLHTSAPTDAAPSTGELSGNGYARQSLASTVVADTADNDADLTFGPNISVAWGTITHAAVWDAVSGGNCLWHGALAAAKAIDVGDEFKISAGNLTLTLA